MGLHRLEGQEGRVPALILYPRHDLIVHMTLHPLLERTVHPLRITLPAQILHGPKQPLERGRRRPSSEDGVQGQHKLAFLLLVVLRDLSFAGRVRRPQVLDDKLPRAAVGLEGRRPREVDGRLAESPLALGDGGGGTAGPDTHDGRHHGLFRPRPLDREGRGLERRRRRGRDGCGVGVRAAAGGGGGSGGVLGRHGQMQTAWPCGSSGAGAGFLRREAASSQPSQPRASSIDRGGGGFGVSGGSLVSY